MSPGVRVIQGVVAQGLATEERFNQTLEQALRDLDSPQYQRSMPVHIATGQRV